MDNKKGIISWDEYFMGVALLSAMRSKDPNTQVGACIVSPDNRIQSIGYNGLPNGCGDDEFPWEKGMEDPLKNKYMYVVHAELNAILNGKGKDFRGCTLYVTLFPCNECAKAIIQSGIEHIVYRDDKDEGKPFNIASRRMLDAAGITYEKYNMEGSRLIQI